MAKRKKAKKLAPDSFQAKLSHLYGKISAYHRLNLPVEASIWAKEMQKLLVREGLLDPSQPPG